MAVATTVVSAITHPANSEGDLTSADTTLPQIDLIAPRYVPTITIEPTATLAEFFLRPITVYELNWTSAVTGAFAFTPYRAYFSNAAIARKIYGNARIRCKLHFRFEWHPTAFHFGRMLFGIVNHSGIGATTPATSELAARLMQQGPHVILDAAAPKVLTLDMPFNQVMNYINTDSGSAFYQNEGPGTAATYLNPAFYYWAIAALGFSNAAAVPSVLISVRCYATEVELVAPTGYAAYSQAGRSQPSELMRSGPISGTLNTVGAAIGGVRRLIPSISSWLKPFQSLAVASADVAALLGFSTPPDIRAPMPVVARPGPSLALVDQTSSSNQVTLYSNTGTTPSMDNMGFSSDDEMLLAKWFETSSFLGEFTWALSNATNDVLCAFPVSPRFVPYDGATNLFPTSIWYASYPFGRWTGTLIYRLTVAASAQHRGRLRIVYEPTGLALGTEPVGQRYNCVFDLDDTKEIDIAVSWNSEQTWLANPITNTVNVSGSPARWVATGATYNILSDNGGLIIYVEAPLTAPQATNNDIAVSLTIRGGPDFLVADPGLTQLQYFVPAANQAGRSQPTQPTSTPVASKVDPAVPLCYLNGPPPDNSHSTMVANGESPVSLRSLLKRYTYYQAIEPASLVGPAAFYYATFRHPPLPLATYTKDVFDGCVASKHPAATYISWYAFGYTFTRGSVRWRYSRVPSQVSGDNFADGLQPRMWAYRRANIAAAAAATLVPLNTLVLLGHGSVASNNDSVLDVTIPIEMGFNALSNYIALPSTNSIWTSTNMPTQHGLLLEGGNLYTSSRVSVDVMCAAGDDFTFGGFIGAPALILRAGGAT